jgi:hypothetical protein
VNSPEIAREALEIMSDANWVRRVVSKTNGRPSEVYVRNPRIRVGRSMPSKWLTWSPATDTNVELTKPTEPSEVTSEGTFVSVSSSGHLPRLRGEAKIFPHCPRGASYALYRKNNQGSYECQSCGLTEITEEIARRVA